MSDTESIFETARLTARPMVLDDLEAFVAYRADPEVARFQSWSDFSLDDGRRFLASLEGCRLGTPGEWCQIALEERSSGALVGDVASKVSGSVPREMEVGFTLASAHQGRGYGTEALRGLLDVAFGALGIHRVIAVTDALNRPAAALLDRVGMRREAHFHENVFFKGAWGSEFLFAMLEHEWDARPTTTAHRHRSPGART
ncbi:MAG: GNAT family N-acetyltransferase [Nocardioides sp.]